MAPAGSHTVAALEQLRPGPVLTPDNQAFWDAARERKLIVQQCHTCMTRYHPPRPMCPSCHSLDLGPLTCSGQGTIHSWTALHYPQSPSFNYPVLAVLVDLAEGVRILSGLLDADAADLRIGRAVRVDFLDVQDGAVLPVFRLEPE